MGPPERAVITKSATTLPIMVRRYIREGSPFQQNTAAGVGL